jgi:hypothetical protein
MARFIGGNGDDTYFGGLDRDVLYGNGGRDWLTGGMNDDYLNGGGGNDDLNGDEGFDRINAGAGDDVVVDSVGGADVSCGAGNDWGSIATGTLRGDRGNDNLSAANGRIEGGPGDDQLGGWCETLDGSGTVGWLQLAGGRGADLFFMGGTNNGVQDWSDIYDFRPWEGDLIDMRAVMPDGNPEPALETARRHDSNMNGFLDDGDQAVAFSEGLLWIDVGTGPQGGDGNPFTSDGDYLVVHGHQALDLAWFAA